MNRKIDKKNLIINKDRMMIIKKFRLIEILRISKYKDEELFKKILLRKKQVQLQLNQLRFVY